MREGRAEPLDLQARPLPPSHPVVLGPLLLAGDARKRDLSMNATMSVILGDTYNKVRAIPACVACVRTVDARADAERRHVH
jgi:hypothetical protein